MTSYADGTIRIWNIETSSSTVTLSGHRSAVTALAFDDQGTRLASGSRDTDLIVWDVIAESGLYRLKGHKDQITCLAFLTKPEATTTTTTAKDDDTSDDVGVAKEGYLVSSSKDTLLKLWDLSAQFCRETVVGHRSEIWSFAISTDKRLILSGGSEPNVKAWQIDWRVLGLSLEALGTVDENDTIDKSVAANAMDVDDDNKEKDELKAATLQKAITSYGNLPRHSRERISTIRFHSSGEFVGVQAADRSVQLYRIRDHDYIQKKIQRRRKRAKEKGKDLDQVSSEVQLEDEIKSQVIVRTQAKVGSFDFAPVKDVAKAGHVQVRLSRLRYLG